MGRFGVHTFIRVSLLLGLFAIGALESSGCAREGVQEAGAEGPRLVHVANWTSPGDGSVEILDVQAATGRVVVTCDSTHALTVLDLSDPRAPRHVANHALPEPYGELTSVAFHPRLNVVIGVVESPELGAPGALYALDSESGELLGSVATGVEPDAVVIDPTGKVAAVANEAERFWLDEAEGTYRSGRGSVSFVDLTGLPDTLSVRTLELPDVSPLLSEFSSHDRFIERDAEAGPPADAATEGGSWRGLPAEGAEHTKKGALLVPLSSTAPELLEPEYVAFSPDGARLYVSLQENNLIAVYDVHEPALRGVWDLGVTHHPADLLDDEETGFGDVLHAFREPDAIAVTIDGRYVVTADEGDTEASPAHTPADAPKSGGRTLSVFDAESGAFLGDTGNQLDAAAAAAGVYPDQRSDRKGCEPEGVVTFEFEGVSYAAVSLERAGAVALVSLADPRAPRVLCVTPLPEGSAAPEGIDVLVRHGSLFVLTANEVSGDVSVFELVR